MPEPEFKDTGTSFVITFRKDIYTEEYLRDLGLNDRQIKAIPYLKQNITITNHEYQHLNAVSKPTASRELAMLVEKGIIVKMGITGRGTAYELKGSNASETPQKRLRNGSKGRQKGETNEVPITQKRKKKSEGDGR